VYAFRREKTNGRQQTMNQLDPYSWSELGGILIEMAIYAIPLGLTAIHDKADTWKARRQMRQLKRKYQNR
jgi:hypothetical protein